MSEAGKSQYGQVVDSAFDISASSQARHTARVSCRVNAEGAARQFQRLREVIGPAAGSRSAIAFVALSKTRDTTARSRVDTHVISYNRNRTWAGRRVPLQTKRLRIIH